MERKDKNFASKGAKTAMSLVLALSLVPSSALAEIASTQEVAQTQEVAATQTSDATTSTAETTAETSAETTTNAEATSNQQTSEQTTAPSDRSSRRVRRSVADTSTELWVDGTNGDDANDGSNASALKSLSKALELQAATPTIKTIHLKGALALTSTVTIPSGVTLNIASDGATVTGSGNSIDGIVLASGATLTGTGTLTMSGFKTALTHRPALLLLMVITSLRIMLVQAVLVVFLLPAPLKVLLTRTVSLLLLTIRAIPTSMSLVSLLKMRLSL